MKIIEEPFGALIETGNKLCQHRKSSRQNLKELGELSFDTLKQQRYGKFRNMGVFEEKQYDDF
jgi:acetyl-CoA carboxylase alpha subunit